MKPENTILDYERPPNNPAYFLASSGVRLANYILDRIFLYVLMLSFVGIVQQFGGAGDLAALFGFLVILIIPCYWIFTEYFFGKTLAKFLTKTKVVSKTGRPPNFGQCVGRTLSRFIPFEPFSFLGSRPIGWHDSLTGTRVVRDVFEDRGNELV